MPIEAVRDISKAGTSAFAVGGGGATQVVLNVPAVAQGYAEVVVANAAITATSKLMWLLVGELDAENDIEELNDTSIEIFAVPEAGQIRFVLTGNAPFAGDFKTNYQVMT